MPSLPIYLPNMDLYIYSLKECVMWLCFYLLIFKKEMVLCHKNLPVSSFPFNVIFLRSLWDVTVALILVWLVHFSFSFNIFFLAKRTSLYLWTHG